MNITNHAQYLAALARIDELWGADAGTERDRELEQLVNTVEQYEAIHYPMSVVSVRLPDDIEQKLAALAEATGRTKSWHAGQAVSDYPDRELWQVAEIQQAIEEADAGDFASEQEVEQAFTRYQNTKKPG